MQISQACTALGNELEIFSPAWWMQESQAGEGGNRSPRSHYVLLLAAQMQGTGYQQVMSHLAWAAASSRSCSVFPGKQPCWLRECCSDPLQPCQAGHGLQKCSFQWILPGFKQQRLGVVGDMRLEECLPVYKGRQLPRGELQFLQELLGSN